MRESGYYRVNKDGAWRIAEWDEEFKSWYITGREEMYDDLDFDEIDPNPINPKP